MTSPRIKRITKLQLLSVIAMALTLALPLSSQAAGGPAKGTTPGKPSVSTGATSHQTTTTALLSGTINPRTFATTYYFQYGATSAYGSQTAVASIVAGTSNVKVSKLVTGIQLGYHYRLVATNADGTSYGDDHTVNPTKTVKPGFTLPKLFEPTPLGGAFLLKGALTGPNNVFRMVVLQGSPYPYRAGYTNIGVPILTGAGGAFAFRVPNLTTSTKFRVSTVGAPILYSAVIPETVSALVTLKARSNSRTGLVRLYGTVSPAAVGAHVFFELEKAPKGQGGPKPEKPIRPETVGKGGKGKHGKSEKSEEKGPTFVSKFNSVVKRGTRTLSRFSAVVHITTTGHYRAFVVLPPGAIVSGHSATVLLHTPPSTKKKKNKKK
jgi:hypothetical protein